MPEKGFNLRARRVCPICRKRIKATDSYSQPGRGDELYHFHCWYTQTAETEATADAT